MKPRKKIAVREHWATRLLQSWFQLSSYWWSSDASKKESTHVIQTYSGEPHALCTNFNIPLIFAHHVVLWRAEGTWPRHCSQTIDDVSKQYTLIVVHLHSLNVFSSTVTIRNLRESSFLRLPTELRNKIYSYVNKAECWRATVQGPLHPGICVRANTSQPRTWRWCAINCVPRRHIYRILSNQVCTTAYSTQTDLEWQ
jgi:hypothetical protein